MTSDQYLGVESDPVGTKSQGIFHQSESSDLKTEEQKQPVKTLEKDSPLTKSINYSVSREPLLRTIAAKGQFMSSSPNSRDEINTCVTVNKKLKQEWTYNRVIFNVFFCCCCCNTCFLDSDWRQQRCKAKILKFSRAKILCVFGNLFWICVLLGGLTTYFEQSMTQQEFSPYSELNECKLTGFNSNTSWGKVCTVNYTIDSDFATPIYFYYKLTNLYQVIIGVFFFFVTQSKTLSYYTYKKKK
ncbi:hypothetical protein RFI_09351 [Reticulomyxa filosa]|uniref:Uncharacterized protein n=1 Tax=Reticulomyxa filosa TaxID=46433 RepID=X6NP31_RETFI|nr:hypothetical protein RFI_09351 [Reticulomyxa filosa]|eukprot:ETO27781.1 hypothetical protein RFI_09351 [Reticulomyxa filosa]